MTKLEVIKKIIGSKRIDDETKVNYIKTFLLGWLNVEDIDWLWE